MYSRIIPAHELRVTFARSSGKGGQNVNKLSTKATIHWSIGCSRVLFPEEKDRVRAKLKNKINWFDELVVTSESERSQAQNRAEAETKLQTLVNRALKIPKKRKATKPSKSSKLKRLESKKLHSRQKQARKSLW